MFKNRKEAGKGLAQALNRYRNKKVLVLAIPKGGIPVAYEVARQLNADFSLLISRKLPYPDNPEAGFGAIAEDGSCFIIQDACEWLSKEQIEKIKNEQKKEIKRRIKVLRKGKKLPKISNRVVILVDDGLAMGSTMRAAVMLCKKKKAKKIIVAVPVASENVSKELEKEVDEIFLLEKPKFFRAVADFYEDWYDISDEEAVKIMEKWKNQ